MFGTHDLFLFIGAMVTLSVIPGPDMMYIVSRSVSQGRMAGVASVLGVSTALLCHSLVVAFGLSNLLSSSQLAFDIVRYAGAAYLLFLGIQAWRKASVRRTSETSAIQDPVPPWRLYRQGFLTGIANPKTTIFFAALLPQFIQVGVHHTPLPFLFLGVIAVVVGCTCDMFVALLSSTVSDVLRSNRQFNYWAERISSVVYIGLALNLLRLKNEQPVH